MHNKGDVRVIARRIGRAGAAGILGAVFALGLSAPAFAVDTVGPVPLPDVPEPTSEFFEYDGSLFFGSYGTPPDMIPYLHRFDGTTVEGYESTSPGFPSEFVELDGELYFAGTSSVRNLFAFGDGTPYVPTGSPDNVADVTVFGGEIVLSGTAGGPSGLFTFDGAAFTPVPGSPTSPTRFLESDGVLYFLGIDAGVQYLYSYDGTTASVVSGSSDANFVEPVAFEDTIYFSKYNGSDNVLYSFDGTTVSAVADSPVDPGSFIVYSDALYLTGEVGGTFPLIRFDGTDFEPLAGSPAEPENGIVYAGRLYFSASEGPDPRTVWSTDGTAFHELSNDVWNMEYPVIFAGSLYFSGHDVVENVDRVWRFTVLDPSVEPGAGEALAATGSEVSAAPLLAGSLLLAAGLGVAILTRRRLTASRQR